jgi:hypothetical protein
LWRYSMADSDLLRQLAARIARLVEQGFTGKLIAEIEMSGGGVSEIAFSSHEKMRGGGRQQGRRG